MGNARYAWVITEDIGHAAGESDDNAVGTSGPHNAPKDLLAQLDAGGGYVFELHYDGDDGIAYKGRILTRNPDGMNEWCAAPLDDFGTGYAGCTDVRYPGHSEWDVG